MAKKSVPLYQKMMVAIMHQVDAGAWHEDDKLPSEKILGEQYQVSRITVRKALAELQKRNYVYTKHGQGTFVTPQERRNQGIDFWNTEQIIAQMGYHPSSSIDRFQVVTDYRYEGIKQQMGLNSDDYLYKIEKTYTADSQRVMYRRVFIAYERFPQITLSELEHTEIIPLICRKYGFSTSNFSLSVTVVRASKQTKYYLDHTHDNVYVFERRGYDRDRMVYLEKAYVTGLLPLHLMTHDNEKGSFKMSTPDIVLTRIDNRLVHGQVGVVWTSAIGANLLLVANDAAAKDELQQELMTATAETAGVGIRFWTLDKTISTIHKASARQHIFLVVKTPADVLTLVKGGVPITEVNVGNMHYSDGKEQISKKVYMDQADKDAINGLIDAGVKVYIKDVPEDKEQVLQKF